MILVENASIRTCLEDLSVDPVSPNIILFRKFRSSSHSILCICGKHRGKLFKLQDILSLVVMTYIYMYVEQAVIFQG